MKRPSLAPTVLLLAAVASHAEPIEALKPMSFLAGHCWKGDFGDGKQTTDEHCFSWLYGGNALRDVHTVRNPGRPDYVGETTYYWDSSANRVEFIYIENLGGISKGTVESSAAGTLSFPPTQYVANGQAMTYRARWTKQADAYEALSEAQGPNGWVPMFKVLLKRQ